MIDLTGNNTPEITIILPVYNGEIYLRETLDSIKFQSFNNYEVLCINDGSTDSSLLILEEMALQDKRFKIYNKTNGGTAVKCLIFALPFSTGKYMFYTSQDDLFSSDLLEKMYARANETLADAILPDMVFFHDDDSDKRLIGINGDRHQILSGKDAFLQSLDWNIHGFSLRKMDLVKKIGYPDFPMNADEVITRKFYLNSNQIAFSEGTFYYRQNNQDALTKKVSRKTFEMIFAEIAIIELMISSNFENDIILQIIERALNLLNSHQVILQNNETKFTKNEVTEISIDLKNAKKQLYVLAESKQLYLRLISRAYIRKIFELKSVIKYFINRFKRNNE